MRVEDEKITFNVYPVMGFLDKELKEESVNFLDIVCEESFREHAITDLLEAVLMGYYLNEDEEAMEYVHALDSYFTKRRYFRKFELIDMLKKSKAAKLSIIEPSELELKPFPDILSIYFLETNPLYMLLSPRIFWRNKGRY